MLTKLVILILHKIKRNTKQVLLDRLNIYSKLKNVFNIILALLVTYVLCHQFKSVERYDIIVYIGIYVFLISLDMYQIFMEIKSLRQVNFSGLLFIKQYLIESISYILYYFLIHTLRTSIQETSEFIEVLFVISIPLLIFVCMPYVFMFQRQIKRAAKLNCFDKLLKQCNIKEKVRFYKYNGKKMKTANAFVMGTRYNRYVFISDYYLENSESAEISAILFHEFAHIKHNDLVKRAFYMSTCILIFNIVPRGMDYMEEHFIHINIPLGIAFLLGLAAFLYLAYKRMVRTQERNADEYAAQKVESVSKLQSAILNFATLNDSLVHVGKLRQLLSSHPSFEKRIAYLEKMKGKGL